MVCEDAKFTREEYERLPEGFPAQLLDGCLVKEPPPSAWHQRLALEIAEPLLRLVGRGRVLLSPVDVPVDRHNVIWPDVMVLPAGSPVRPRDRRAATPVLVVEILSPSTARRDREQKAGAFLRAGVREVWLVDPDAETVEILTPEGIGRYAGRAVAVSDVVDGLRVVPEALFHPED